MIIATISYYFNVLLSQSKETLRLLYTNKNCCNNILSNIAYCKIKMHISKYQIFLDFQLIQTKYNKKSYLMHQKVTNIYFKNTFLLKLSHFERYQSAYAYATLHLSSHFFQNKDGQRMLCTFQFKSTKRMRFVICLVLFGLLS